MHRAIVHVMNTNIRWDELKRNMFVSKSVSSLVSFSFLIKKFNIAVILYFYATGILTAWN